MNKNDIHSQQVYYQNPYQYQRVAQLNAVPQHLKNTSGQRQFGTMQNSKPQQYHNIYNPQPVQEVQRARASISEDDPSQRKVNIKFLGSVPKYEEQDQVQSNGIQQSQQNKRNKIKIISSQKQPNAQDLTMNQANGQVNLQNQEFQNQQIRQQRAISQEPIYQQKIKILSQKPSQVNYCQPIIHNPPTQFKIKTIRNNQGNEEYFTNNQSNVSQKSSASKRPASRNQRNQNAIRQMQENQSIFQKTGQSIYNTVVKTQEFQVCKECEQTISSDIIMLSCQHSFHEKCFHQIIQNQANSGTSCSCYCGVKIKLGQWKSDENIQIFIDQILKNQVKVIKEKNKNILQSCQNCEFFCVKQNHSIISYCPLCLL